MEVLRICLARKSCLSTFQKSSPLHRRWRVLEIKQNQYFVSTEHFDMKIHLRLSERRSTASNVDYCRAFLASRKLITTFLFRKSFFLSVEGWQAAEGNSAHLTTHCQTPPEKFSFQINPLDFTALLVCILAFVLSGWKEFPIIDTANLLSSLFFHWVLQEFCSVTTRSSSSIVWVIVIEL